MLDAMLLRRKELHMTTTCRAVCLNRISMILNMALFLALASEGGL
jgi:hypothetical protein